MELNFANGMREYNVNDKAVIHFNPTDSEFIHRLYDAFDMLEKKQDAYNAEVQKCGNNADIFRIAKERDAEMRTIIDGIFDEPVCDKVFGGVSLYALADGLHVWTNFMLAILDEVNSTFQKERNATNPRLKKYTDKYKK